MPTYLSTKTLSLVVLVLNLRHIKPLNMTFLSPRFGRTSLFFKREWPFKSFRWRCYFQNSDILLSSLWPFILVILP